MLTRESVAKRKAQLEEQNRQGIATLNAIAGALQDCDFWLAEIDKVENPVPVETSAPVAELAVTETPAPSA